MPIAGLVSDRFDRRRLLIVTQGVQSVLTFLLAVLAITGWVELWQVYIITALLGITTAMDNPARQTFVAELVPPEHLSNAVALNSSTIQAARVVGPALAGLMIMPLGSGWVFLVNAVSFAGVLVALVVLGRRQPASPRLVRARGQMLAGLRYVRGRADVVVVLTMVFIVGTFGFNMPIFVSTMSSIVFSQDAATYGLLTSVLAVGALAGALSSARRDRAQLGVVVAGAAAFGVAGIAAALAPSVWTFGALLAGMGFASLTMMTTANGYVQTTTPPELRGRIMALYLAIFAGGTPIGAPIVGAVANSLGPRAALLVGAAAGIVSATIAIAWFIGARGLRVRRVPETRFRVRLGFADTREEVAEEIAAAETTNVRS